MTSKKQKKKGHPIPEIIDPGALAQYCVTIPDAPEYHRAFVAVITTLTKWWSWDKSYLPGDYRARDTAQLWRDVMQFVIVDNCGGGGDMPIDFRENPGDPCEVQYSNDGGETWLTAFRKDNCRDASSVTIDIDTVNNSTTTINNNNAIYQGDITNISIDWTYSGVPAEDAVKDAALCWAIRKHVQWICETRISQIKEGNEDLKDAANFAFDCTDPINAVSVAVALSASGPPGALVAATAWAAGKIWVNVIATWLGTDYTEFEDEDAREAIACAMWEQMRGSTPQFSNWSTSLSSFVPSNDAEEAIYGAVNEVNQDEDVYVNYLLIVENIVQVAASLPPCPCPSTWEHTWDFENFGMEAWVFRNVQTGYYKGVYVAGQGVQSELDSFGGAFTGMVVYDLDLLEPIPGLTGFTIRCDVVLGNTQTTGTALGVRFDGLPSLSRNFPFWTEGYNVKDFTIPEGDADNFRLSFFRTSDVTDGDVGSSVIRSITLRGNGQDPFLGRVTS